jgi:hypothetical protein
MFFVELLEPLGISHLLDFEITPEIETQIKRNLAQVSLSVLLNFIASLEVIFKQLGNLLIQHKHYLIKLAKVLVIAISIAKEFVGHLK